MGLPVNSTNIVMFGFTANYNLGTQVVTLTNNTTYQGSGEAATQGINFTLTSPSGVVYNNGMLWGTNANIPPASMTNIFTKAMQVFAGAVEYGIWIATGNIKEANGVIYSYTQTLNICSPPQCDTTTGSNGCANPQVAVNCQQNVLLYQDKTVYTFQGVVASTITYSVIETYPAISGLSPTTATIPFFAQSPIYDGEYTFTVSNTATYVFGEQSVTIVYTATELFNAQCFFLCNIRCAFDKYFQDYLKIAEDGSQQSRTMKDNLSILSAYLNSATLAIECGGDASDAIAAIKEITHQGCSCACGQNTAIGVFTAQNVNVIAGCGTTVVPTTVGLTTTWTINANTYTFSTTSSGLNIEADLEGCNYNVEIDICGAHLPICDTVVLQQVDPTNINNNTAAVYEGADELVEWMDGVSNQIVNIRTYLQGLPLVWTSLNPDFNSGWAANGSYPCKYSKDNLGNIYLKGSAQSSGSITVNNTPTLIATLPVGFRPAQNSILKGWIQDTATTYSDIFISILTNGSVVIDCPYSSHTTTGVLNVSFDGIVISTIA